MEKYKNKSKENDRFVYRLLPVGEKHLVNLCIIAALTPLLGTSRIFVNFVLFSSFKEIFEPRIDCNLSFGINLE